jgi:parallel beta-helix repeat protein
MKAKWLSVLSMLGFLLLAPVRSYGANYFVPDDFTTIQGAIDDPSVIDGDTIIVRDGTYYEVIDFVGKAITVQSENGPSNTIIDAEKIGPVVGFFNGEGPDSVLDGFTITNGHYMLGGGISAMENSPTILNCIITGNESPYGGGIFDYGEEGATITDCIISNNMAFQHGGGVYTISAKVTNCTIRDNVASDAGGGISFGFGDSYPSLAIIANCIINNNTAGTVGGGIRCDDLSPSIVNCTVSSNSATSNGGGIYCSGTDGPTVVNSIFWGNSAGGSPNEISAATIDITYSDIEEGWTGTGNIDSDPLFVDLGYGDFHLQSGSPCINVGNNSAVPPGLTTDFEGDERIFDTGTVEMGADEHAPTVLRANFSADPTMGVPPLTVQFTDHSTGSPTVWSWDFDNDGEEDSSVQNPSFTYTSEGTYTVSLTVTRAGQDTDAVTKTDYINVGFPPVAAFTADPTSGTAHLDVQFTDQSTGSITSWSWDFGDGGTSSQQNPSYTYTSAGDFTVSLTATGPGGSDTETKVSYIHVTEPAPVAAFTANVTSGTAPLTVQFTDQSSGGIDSWSWDFGDGGSSSLQNPSYTYSDAGDFTVDLTVTGPGGSDTEMKMDYIHVTASPHIYNIQPRQQEASVPNIPAVMNWLNSALGYTCPACIQTVRYGRIRLTGENFGPSRLTGDQVRIGDPRSAAPIELQYDTDADPFTVETIYGGVSLYIGPWGDDMIGVYLYPEPGQVLRALYGPDLGIGLHWLGTWLGLWVVKDNEGAPVASNVEAIKILTPLPD